MADELRQTLPYEPRPRRRRASWRERVADVLSISLALLWPIWAFGVTRYLTAATAHGNTMPPLGVALIVATFALPLGFGAIVAGFVPSTARRRRARTGLLDG